MTESPFFPPGLLDDHPELDRFKASWYAGQLRSLGEPPLWRPDAQPGAAYRLLWLPSFHGPVAVRAERSPSGATLVSRVLALPGERGAQPRLDERARALEASEWASIEDEVRGTAFFDTPTRGGRMGLDGSQWVFEARGAGPHRYHLVDRWQPDHGDPFRRLCLRLAELGGVAGEVGAYG